jgi:hypothetical protein
MKEPLSQRIFGFLEPQQKAPVKGYLVKKKTGGPSTLNIDMENIQLKGSDYHVTLPWGVGVATKDFGFWNVVQPEVPHVIRSKQEKVELILPAANDLKISYKGTHWLVVLDRDYDKIDLDEQRALFVKKASKFAMWLFIAAILHIGFYYVALNVPFTPISWIENTVSPKDVALPSFEDQVIEEAKKNTAVLPEDDFVKVKFNFFNGLPWNDQKIVTEQNVQRLDTLLKALKGKDITIGFDDKGATNAADALKQGQQQAGKGSLISKVFSKSNSLVTPKLSQLQSTNRNLSAAELKLIRETFQSITPEMSLAYQRVLSKNPQLALGLRYETTVDANGRLSKVRFQTSGVGNSVGLADLLSEIKGIFERTTIGKGLSSVTIQGENVFKNQ